MDYLGTVLPALSIDHFSTVVILRMKYDSVLPTVDNKNRSWKDVKVLRNQNWRWKIIYWADDFNSGLLKIISKVHWIWWLLITNYLPSVLWHCWLGSRKGIRPVKNSVVGCWHGMEQGADLHIAQVKPLPLTISYSSKSRLVLPEWFCFSGAGLPGMSWKKAIKRM